MGRKWTPEEIEYVKAIYPHKPNKEIAQEMGDLTTSRVEGFGRRNRLKKKPIEAIFEGAIFGKLKVVRMTSKKSKNNWLWRCVCECGKECDARAALLRKGKKTSCGCETRLAAGIGYHGNKIGESHHNRKGFGGIGGTLWSRLISHAIERGMAVSVTCEYIWNLFQSQDGKCALSGLELTIPSKFTAPESQCTASLDRIDSSKGYVEDNVQWVHKRINLMKNKHTTEEFIDLCRAVVKNADRNVV